MAPRPPGPNSPPRRLIVNADDFGRSASINQAVVRAHQEGILTTASLMVNEPAFEEAVALARETLPAADRRSMVAAELMGSVYWRLLRKLERQRFDVFGPELTRLNKGQKVFSM